MHDRVLERPTFAARHDFDKLQKCLEIEVRPARLCELSALAEMANRLVPGVQIAERDLENHSAFDPDSIVTFRRNNKLLGAVAFLYLNCRGHDALILDEINLTQPDVGLLAERRDEVSAIYVWAIAGQGRAMAGLGNVSTHLSSSRLAPADLFAQPSSADGRNLMVALGFNPVPSYQHELWCYERPWNRAAPRAQAFYHPARSFADARH
jgi:hypothetical protein